MNEMISDNISPNTVQSNKTAEENWDVQGLGEDLMGCGSLNVGAGEAKIKRPVSENSIKSDKLDEGRKDDGDKDRFDLIPPEGMFAVARVLTFGARKYDERNWERGMKWSRVFGALMRHMWAWWAGKGPTSENFAFGSLDDETGFSHLWHAGCCIMMLIAFEQRTSGTDDRFTG